MPLTKQGKIALRNFKKKHRFDGESMFYRWLNTLPPEKRKKFEE